MSTMYSNNVERKYSLNANKVFTEPSGGLVLKKKGIQAFTGNEARVKSKRLGRLPFLIPVNTGFVIYLFI